MSHSVNTGVAGRTARSVAELGSNPAGWVQPLRRVLAVAGAAHALAAGSPVSTAIAVSQRQPSAAGVR
jgi:hypothetical protein